VKTIECAGTDQ